MYELCRLEECNPDNLELLKKYRIIMKNKGSTDRSIEAFCEQDLSLLLRFLKDKSLQNITNLDIEEFLYYCQAERHNGSEAVNRKYTSMNSFFRQLIKKDILSIRNPLDKIDRPKVRKNPRGYLKPNEIRAMLDFAESISDLRSKAMILLFYASGCRISEIHQLNRDSLNCEALTFSVLGKGDKIRTCIFSQDAKEAILRYLASRRDNLEPLFLSREHNRLSKCSMRASLRKIAQGAGISQRVFCHLLRHSIATNSIKVGVKIQDIKLLLGHSSIASTEIYAKENLLEVRNEFNKVYENIKC